MKTLIKFAIPLIGLGAILGVRSLHKDLYDRFPTLDKKVVRKAYWTFYRKALTNHYGDISDATDAQMDQYFLQEVAALQPAA